MAAKFAWLVRSPAGCIDWVWCWVPWVGCYCVRLAGAAGVPKSPPARYLALALLAFLLAVLVDANGFVAAFVAGSAFGALTHRGGEKEVST